METRSVILIISDEKPIIKLLRSNLLTEGDRVVAATDAVAAIKLLKEHQPSLAIFDTTEPISENVKAFNTVRPHCFFPIIILIARNGVTFFRDVLTPEDEFLVKPFDIQKLLGLVRAKLKGSRQ